MANMEVEIWGLGVPDNGWFIREKPIYKWMMTGGTQIWDTSIWPAWRYNQPNKIGRGVDNLLNEWFQRISKQDLSN